MSGKTNYRIMFSACERAELVPFQPDITPLGPDEVSGRTLVTLISPGTELAVYRGNLGRTFPRPVGYAAVFEVEAVGSEIKSLKVGDRALCMGPHQSVQRCREQAHLPLRLPDGLSVEHAPFARMMGVSWSTLTTTVARPPAKVLVTGLGLVGHLAARIFDIAGYEVIACDPWEARRALAIKAGVRKVLPAVPLNDRDIAGKVALVVECSGHEQAVLDGCAVVQKRGEVVLVGLPWMRRTDIFAHDLLYRVFHKYVVLRSGWEWEVPRFAADFQPDSIHGNLAGAMQWLVERRLTVADLYVKVPPRQAQQAYQDLLKGRSDCLSFLFDWADCP